MSNAPRSHDHLGRLRKRKKPASQRVGIVMDSDYQTRLDEAQRRVSQLELKANLHAGKSQKPNPELADELDRARDELEEAEKAAESQTEWFIAKALSPRYFDELMNKYPPTKEQKAQARKDNVVASFDLDKFPPVLIAECVYLVTKTGEVDDDGVEVEEHTRLDDAFVKEMMDGAEDAQWNQGEVTALFGAAMAANQRGPSQRVSQLGNG